MRRIRIDWLLALMMLSGGVCFGAEQDAITFEGDVNVTMRDGVVLRADIYRPSAEGKYPVLLQRTPYDKRNFAFGLRGASRGYVVIIQDVRGRYASDGEWYTFKNEANDGYDTIEWAAALPYSNGKVGMFGGSYVGATQMLAAIMHPPHLAGICPIVTSSNYHASWTYQGGAFEQWFNESWTSGLAHDTLNRKVKDATNAVEGMWELPLSSYPLFNLRGTHAIGHGHSRAVLSGLDRSSQLRRLLEACFDRRAFRRHYGSGSAHRGVVRHFSRRLAAQL
jgi:predicted acyl esterase